MNDANTRPARIVGFSMPTVFHDGAQQILMHQEVFEVTGEAYEEMRAAHSTICDLTPRATAMGWGLMPHQHTTALVCTPCPRQCWNEARMTVCPLCGGSERILTV